MTGGPDAAPSPRTPAAIWALIAVCTALEAALWLGGAGAFGEGLVRLRQLAYDFGAFWPGLLHGWRPNYPSQPMAMFVTYGFLHGGPGHLAMNMLTLWSLGRAVAERAGAAGTVAIYLATMFGGAALFGLMARTPQPMVGASGALFGLAGAVLAWEWADRRAARDRLWPVVRVALLLAGLNLVMWLALDGHLAWETHLGGFVVGWAAGLWWDRWRPGRAPDP